MGIDVAAPCGILPLLTRLAPEWDVVTVMPDVLEAMASRRYDPKAQVTTYPYSHPEIVAIGTSCYEATGTSNGDWKVEWTRDGA